MSKHLEFEEIARMDGFRASLGLRLRLWYRGLLGQVYDWSGTYTFEDGTVFAVEGWTEPEPEGGEFITRVDKVA